MFSNCILYNISIAEIDIVITINNALCSHITLKLYRAKICVRFLDPFSPPLILHTFTAESSLMLCPIQKRHCSYFWQSWLKRILGDTGPFPGSFMLWRNRNIADVRGSGPGRVTVSGPWTNTKHKQIIRNNINKWTYNLTQILQCFRWSCFSMADMNHQHEPIKLTGIGFTIAARSTRPSLSKGSGMVIWIPPGLLHSKMKQRKLKLGDAI